MDLVFPEPSKISVLLIVLSNGVRTSRVWRPAVTTETRAAIFILFEIFLNCDVDVDIYSLYIKSQISRWKSEIDEVTADKYTKYCS